MSVGTAKPVYQGYHATPKGVNVAPTRETDPQRVILNHVRHYYQMVFQRGDVSRVKVPKGRELAVLLNYPKSFIDRCPQQAWKRFVPSGCPIPYLMQLEAHRILNLGCGLGLDAVALLLDPSAGKKRIVNLDVSWEALGQGREIARKTLLTTSQRISWVCASGTDLPFKKGIFDAVFMNGVYNLFPNKNVVLRNVRDILKKGGWLLIADLFCYEEVPEEWKRHLDAWAWCIAGAEKEKDLASRLASLAFSDYRVQERIEICEPFYRAIVMARFRTL